MPSGLHVHRSIELLELPQLNKLMRREVAGLLQQSYPTELFMATGAPPLLGPDLSKARHGGPS